MALVLNATWGSDVANSYCTVAESIAYHESRYHTSDWLDASVVTTSIKNATLVWASNLIDQLFKWDGTKISQTQARECPRYGLLDINGWPIDMITKPTWIANATAEYAYQLYLEDLISSANTDVTESGSPDLAGFKEITVGPITLKSSIGESSSSSSSSSSAVNIMPLSVYLILKPYGNIYTNQSRRIVR
jgi:hypothetical protein